MVVFWRTGVHQKTGILVTFSPPGTARVCQPPGPGDPQGRPGPAQPQPSPYGSGSALNTPNGAFKGGPKAGLRRPPVQDAGNRGLCGAVRPLQSVI